ncbi:MAG: TetR/AcrR family transcriptional regulator, partial [Firmicutes bacterium]|nr:TetR/AcrR family transcriptional regulator [Bacillota bacterium]
MKKQPEITDKTRQNFVSAFWSLAEEKPISKITVSTLTKRAGYNRSTFYEYFLDIVDLLNYIETSLLNDIKDKIRQCPNETNFTASLFQTIFVAMNEKIYLLLGPNGDLNFFTRVKAELIPVVKSFLPFPSDTPYFDYLVCFVNGAAFSLLQDWNAKGRDISIQ